MFGRVPILSVNQRLPSGPAAIPDGLALAVGTGYSVTTPAVVTLATLLPRDWVSQRLPPRPAAMPAGKLLVVGTGYSVMTPAGVTLATMSPAVANLPAALAAF